MAVMSEDPHDWDDVIRYWPRYWTPAVAEFVDGLPITVVDAETAMRGIDESEQWVVINLVEKRILTSPNFDPVGRDFAYIMSVEDPGKPNAPLSIHLPPWWELLEQVEIAEIRRPRRSPIEVPTVNRNVLFGDAMITEFAYRILKTARSDRWQKSDADKNRKTRHSFTIEVHREWLMTPREDLNGMMPRQLLHGAQEWIDQLAWGQRIRHEDGSDIIAAAEDASGYENAPMGSEEMVIYFDLCRELIEAGWNWCSSHDLDLNRQPDCLNALIQFLGEVKTLWLSSPYEGGSPPSFIIECSRRRVPRGAGVPIVGMSERQAEEHIVDCNCPICNMMAEGMFGTAFEQLSGYHLDLDDEFAFSLHESYEDWEENQRAFGEMSTDFNPSWSERDVAGNRDPDEFASVWSGGISDTPIPGDTYGHLKLAFMLAEIVTALDLANAPCADIRLLNTSFTQFRQSGPERMAATGRQLSKQLESLALQIPVLIPRIADFQSRIEEQIRVAALDSSSDLHS
jgi:hypothetical protein